MSPAASADKAQISAAAVHPVVHGGRPGRAASGFLVVLEVVGVPRHHHANAVRAQEIAHHHELPVVVGHVVATRKERMAEHRITILPRDAEEAARSRVPCSTSTPRSTPVSIARSANDGVCN